jgi:hypothetical protein
MVEKKYTKLTPFKWNTKRDLIAEMLAAGETIKVTAKTAGVSESTIKKYKARSDFREEVDRLSLMVDIASRASRVRMAKRIIREREQEVERVNNQIGKGQSVKPMFLSNKDILDWLKYIKSETEDARLFTEEQIDTIIAFRAKKAGLV